MEQQIRFCTSADGTRIAYTTMGEGPPLVYVSGWMGSVERDVALLKALGRGRLLVSSDRRGVGASQRDVDDVSLEPQVADVAAVVDRLELRTFDLFGLAEGAAISVAYAAQHADRVSGLALWGSYPCGEEVTGGTSTRGLVELILGNWSLARRALADVIFPAGPIEMQRWLSNSFRELVSPEVAAKHVKFWSSADVRPYLSQVRAPTLVIHRRNERNTPISAGRRVAASIPDARFVAIEGESPWVFEEDAETLMRAINEFLSEGEESAPVSGLAAEDIHTILFTDVEGSTALTDRLGDAKARDLLREHERITREALKTHSGSEVKTMGDGFMASFSSATKALECAMALQRAFAQRNESAEEPILVRVGLNAGEPIAEDDDLFGASVNRAARIAAMAQGGEILVANVVRELAEGKEFMFGDRGETALRGFDDPVRLFEVRWREAE
ncbi:MAG TPA: adenylate/guanylate cyclase domain-containing protein [Dehalococcoidia bacterium]